MEKISACLLLLLMAAFSLPCFAQNPELDGEEGTYPLEANNATHPCISKREYELIAKKCADNRTLLGLSERESRSTNTTSLAWPLKAETNLSACSYYTIGYLVDHDPATGHITDYKCGIKTYDGHRGTDISIYPFPFYKMDNSQVEVIAAAAGTIMYKEDGNFDKNCSTNSSDANAIIITHADGSQALYWHLKTGSLTAKAVGQTVAAGEYLGVVGSSGNSTGPHLHFEVWNGSMPGTLVDPFSGGCNSLNAGSWWASQKPYTDPTVLKVSVNTTDFVVPACPATETPNESNSFATPFQGTGLPAGYAKFYLFMRDDTVGNTASLSILNPNNTVFNSWTYTSNTYYRGSYWGWSKLLPTAPGTYTFKAVYHGTTCSTNFNISTATSMNEPQVPSAFKVYPNFASSTANISVDESMFGSWLTITDITGRKIMNSQLFISNTQLAIQDIPDGIYFFTLNKGGQAATQKLIIRH